MIGKLFAVIIGISIIGLGIAWNKKGHEERLEDAFLTSTGSFIGDILVFIFIFIMGILPWYVFKTILILMGLLLIYAVIIS